MRFALASLLALTAVATAAPKASPPKAHPAWVGVFRPSGKLEPSDARAVVGRAGEIVALTPSSGAPAPDGDVTIVQPLVGMNITATLAHERTTLPLFAIDRRPGADAVLIVPADTRVVFVEPSKADVVAIRAALMRNEVLSGVKRALADLEVGAIDVDGDRAADFAVTYGCNAWADGQCQGRGQFLLARRGNSWVELE